MAHPTTSLADEEEIDRYEEAVENLRSGQMDPDRFMAFRLQHGIYGQRQDDEQMIRIKIPGGRVSPDQLTNIADGLDTYSRDHGAAVTTRQDIQFHFVKLNQTPALLRHLATAGLTTREACGNTVRNVTACSLAGVCPREHVDVTTFVNGAVDRFLRNPLTQHLPRKFKISFSGCESDCAMGLMHDVGVVARRHEGKFGFKVLAGGGLGHKPHAAVVVEEFVAESELIPVIEALVALHNRYSDRKKRAKARIKFLVDRFGVEGFIEKYKEELARSQAAFDYDQSPRGQWRDAQLDIEPCGAGAPRKPYPLQAAGQLAVPVSLSTGDITGAQMRGIADLMRTEGLDDVRTTVDQNLILVGVRQERLGEITDGLMRLGLGLPKNGDDVVSCPGTTTCRLGITSSKLIAPKLSGGTSDIRVRVSGCHNSCGQHHVGDIGIHGEGKRVHGRLVPCYVTHFGGDGTANGAIAIKGPVIPTLRIETAVSRVEAAYAQEHSGRDQFHSWAQSKGREYFVELLADLSDIQPEDVPALARDHGEEDSFRVLQLGGGECAGAAQDHVASNFSEAMHERNYRNGFAFQRKYTEALECADQVLRLVGNSVLFLLGSKPADSVDAAVAALTENGGSAGQLALELGPLLASRDQLNKLEDIAPEEFDKFAKSMDAWVVAAGRLCQQMDQQLDLATSLPELAGTAAQSGAELVIDLTDVECPLHYIKARNALRNQSDGTVMTFVVKTDESAQQISASLAEDGHDALGQEQKNGNIIVRIRKVEAPIRAIG